jgi:hypothetical protein
MGLAFIWVTGYKNTELSWREVLIERLKLRWEDSIRMEINIKRMVPRSEYMLNVSNILFFSGLTD